MEYSDGKSISVEKYLVQKEANKAPPHEKAAAVNEIVKVLGENKTYNYAYWLRKIGNASYSTVLGILKEAGGLEKKYNKGGYITNKLKPYAVKSTRVKSNRPRATTSTKRKGLPVV